ncbi:MAG: metallophosphoesterase [Smithella sp.]|jgi:hypothetical protein
MKSLKVTAQIIDPGVQPTSMLNLGQKLNLSCPISLKEICNGYNIDLTLVWIGDIHFENYSKLPTAWNLQTKWIVDNIATYNIQAVLCAGDIQNPLDPNQFEAAWKNDGGGLASIYNSGLPYLVAVGNHDYPNLADYTNNTPSPRDTSYFDTYLGYQKLKNLKSWYVGCCCNWQNPLNNDTIFNSPATQAIQFTVQTDSRDRNFLVICSRALAPECSTQMG